MTTEEEEEVRNEEENWKVQVMLEVNALGNKWNWSTTGGRSRRGQDRDKTPELGFDHAGGSHAGAGPVHR